MKQQIVNKKELSAAERLRNLRLDRRLTSSEVAEGSGISRPFLSKLENGASPLKFGMAKKLARFYGVSEDWLLTGQASPLGVAQERFQEAIEASGLDADAEAAIDEITLWLRQLIAGHESMRKPALAKIQAITEGFAEQCAKRNGPIRQASLEMARARFSEKTLKLIDALPVDDISKDYMSELWPDLLKRIKSCLRAGSQYSLAKRLGISRQSVHQYITGASAPSAEITLRLLQWVQETEGQKNEGPAGADTPAGPVTRKRNIDQNEKIPRPPKP